ncbi:MAG: uroporphyrinogen-III synthase [Sulfurospirillaceae bacterium]|nr:uroporphyrinogen-III synthase [Sulfurospirillaceae bacterium]
MIYLFSDKKYEGVEHLPLIEIVFYDKKLSLNGFDALIFTSKNSVEAVDRLCPEWKHIEAFAIGEATASYIIQKGGKLAYTSKNAYGDEFAHSLIPLLATKKAYFPRAKEIVSLLPDILITEHIELFQEVLYETRCISYPKNVAPQTHSALIFTSPSTVTCFFKNFDWHESYKAIAIGHKTAAVFPLHVNCQIAQKQTIEACIALAKGI